MKKAIENEQAATTKYSDASEWPVDYMNGHCHVFATALHRKLGFDYLVLLDKTEKYPGGIHAVHHVYALDRTGAVYDFLGKHDAKNILAQWMHIETPFSRPGHARIRSEEKLSIYVEPTLDGWSRPLSCYSDSDVELALEKAKERLANELPALLDESLGLQFRSNI